jgi:2-polyprenylphenol 6-hydroxylase
VQCDLIVVGGGPVGASLARAARGVSVALVAHERPPAPPVEGFDARVYALSPGNAEFLRAIGAWPDRVVPVHAMRVYGDEANAQLEFDAYGAGVAELAWIVEDSRLQQALWRDLEVVAARSDRLGIDDEGVQLALADGSTRASPRASAITARARWWRTSAAKSRMAMSPINGFSAGQCLLCCRCPAITCPWSGRCLLGKRCLTWRAKWKSPRAGSSGNSSW